MLQRVTANKLQAFQHKEGALKVLGIYSRIFPIISLVLTEKVFGENFDKKKVNDLFYLVGETQSYQATTWTVKKVGIPVKGNELRIFNETAGHSEVTGLGKPETIKFDMKNKIIIAAMSNNVFCQQYLKLFGLQEESVDHYLRGLFGGTAKFLFGEEVVVSCEECMAMGKQRSIYKIFPRKDCIKKYGESVKKFIPDESLNINSLEKFDVKKLVV